VYFLEFVVVRVQGHVFNIEVLVFGPACLLTLSGLLPLIPTLLMRPCVSGKVFFRI